MAGDETFEGFLRTGSGSERVTLELTEAEARIVIEYRWMGQGDEPRRCELRFRHEPGKLELLSAAAGDDELTPVPELSDGDALLPLIVEYVRVPPTPVRVHPQSQLAAMRPLGYATWNDHFDLLLLPELEGWPEASLWEHVRLKLDKARLARR
ncbi:hypothetical protein DMH04_34365 [Kibdelosporangium aridum]|uniref:Uncharacterized protein n=1 Tax=Kibdelosporangium aridum TaxID=2030 RepID=A0A428Z0N5_KIBAR|nr:hypothetical protein [Kibdelosporangium aridum]RSM77806.1 hypothetical protein DMH04_34365 [Kibdelosporangium aridum]